MKIIERTTPDFFKDQVSRWVTNRIELGSQKKVSFKYMYEDYRTWVINTTDESLLARGSFAHYVSIIFQDSINSGKVRKIKSHPVTFENLSISDSIIPKDTQI